MWAMSYKKAMITFGQIHLSIEASVTIALVMNYDRSIWCSF